MSLAFPRAPPRLGRARRSELFRLLRLRRSEPLNHLSPLPSPRSLSKSPRPCAVPRSPPTGKPSHGAPSRSLRPGSAGPLRPAPPRPPSAPACLRDSSGGVGAAGPGKQKSRAAGWACPGSQLLPERPPVSGAARRSRPRSAATRGGATLRTRLRELRPLFPRSASAPRHPAAEPGAAPAGPAVAAALLSELRQRTLPTASS